MTVHARNESMDVGMLGHIDGCVGAFLLREGRPELIDQSKFSDRARKELVSGLPKRALDELKHVSNR
jgi:hypothetical protein